MGLVDLTLDPADFRPKASAVFSYDWPSAPTRSRTSRCSRCSLARDLACVLMAFWIVSYTRSSARCMSRIRGIV